MPGYQLFCLARPALAAPELAKMIQRVAETVYSKGGVVMDLKSFGEQHLAYKIRGSQGKHEQASMWQLEFAVGPEALRDVNHELRVNDQVLRWAVVKRPLVKPLERSRHLFHQHPQFGVLLRPPRGYARRNTVPTDLSSLPAVAAAASRARAVPSAPTSAPPS